jgi:hypothetical protein
MELITGIDDLTDFPVSNYYKGRVREARTINAAGGWWTAILLIEDPKTEKLILVFYRWQKRNGEWKVAKSFKCNSKKDARKMAQFIDELSEQLI